MHCFAPLHSAALGTPTMIQTLFARFHRWLPQPGDELVLHAWTDEDSNWHSSSLDLARGLEVTEVAGSIRGARDPQDRPDTAPVFLDMPPAVHAARR